VLHLCILDLFEFRSQKRTNTACFSAGLFGLHFSFQLCKYKLSAPCTEVVFLDIIGTKKLKTFALCYSQATPPADFTHSYRFLGLEDSIATAESGWGLGFV
jgi:hypothetical protein